MRLSVLHENEKVTTENLVKSADEDKNDVILSS